MSCCVAATLPLVMTLKSSCINFVSDYAKLDFSILPSNLQDDIYHVIKTKHRLNYVQCLIELQEKTPNGREQLYQKYMERGLSINFSRWPHASYDPASQRKWVSPLRYVLISRTLS